MADFADDLHPDPKHPDPKHRDPDPGEPDAGEPDAREPDAREPDAREPNGSDAEDAAASAPSSAEEAAPGRVTGADVDAPEPGGAAVAEGEGGAGVAVEGEALPMRSGFVAILGKPNVGKSTLLNTLLGVKVAPISAKPQTTRQGVRGIHTDVEGRRQLVFVDTPGLHRGRTALDDFMTREIRGAVADVEVILWVVDLRRPPGDEDREVARLLRGLDPDATLFLIGNKLDVAKYPEEAMELYAELGPEPARRYMLSALNEPKAVYDLRTDLLDLLPEAPFYFPENVASDQTREQWAGEIVRESAMTHLYQEIPYTVAVRVTDWDDPEPGVDEPVYVRAEIWVEKRQHRPIVIGRAGRMIREIGRTARKQLEIFLDRQVFLELEVVVRPDWRMDPEALRELGYSG